jgi:hypothetical protein
VTADWSDPFDKLEAMLPSVADAAIEMAIRYAVVHGREAARARVELEAENGALRGALRDRVARSVDQTQGGSFVSEEQRKKPSNLTEWLAESPHARRVILSIPTRPDPNDLEADWRHDPTLLQFDFRTRLPDSRIISVRVVMQDDYLHTMENAEDLIQFAELSLEKALGSQVREGGN